MAEGSSPHENKPFTSFSLNVPLNWQLPTAVMSTLGGWLQLIQQPFFRRTTSVSTGLKAEQVSSALSSVNQFNWKHQLIGVVQIGGVVCACGQLLHPQGPGACDRTACDRCCNIATSVPYVIAGVHSIRERKTAAGKAWGASIIGVGLASATFHASHGKWRDLGRKLDYWAIALSSNMLVRACYPNLPSMVTYVGVLATPFKPFLVSFANTVAMELEFLRQARKHKELQPAHILHSACCIIGLGAFAWEDSNPNTPLVHSAWHCLSAVSVATTNALMKYVEEHSLQMKPLLC